MTSRSVLVWGCSLAICLAIGLALDWQPHGRGGPRLTRARPLPESRIRSASSALESTKVTPDSRAPQDQVAAQVAILREPGAVDRWWVFRQRSAHECCSRGPSMIASGTGAVPEEWTSGFGELAPHDGDILVLERRGRRVALPAVEASGVLRARPDRSAIPEDVAAIATRITVRDAGTARPMQAWLFDAHGVALGPIGGDAEQILLPAGFIGSVCCDGYAPRDIAIRSDKDESIVVDLHRAACFRGQLDRMPADPRARLIAHGLDPSPHSAPEFTADLRADGSFHFGPIPIGRYSLHLESETAWLHPPVRAVEVSAHGQDAGVFEVEVFATLHIALKIPGAVVPKRLHVLARRSDREPAPGASPITLPVAPDGHVELAKTRPVPLVLDCWTDDGFCGHASGVLAVDHPRDRPLILALDTPGTIDAFVDLVAFRVPHGSRVVARPHGADGPIRAASDAEARCRVAEVDANGKARLAAVWPGPTELTMLSPQGVALATTTTALAPGSRDTIVLRPEVPVACLVLRAPVVHAQARVACLTWAKGKTTRIALHSTSSTEALLPAGSYRLRLIGREGDLPERIVHSSALELRAGERVIVDV